ncbi:NAD(P)/FAD-dependent oxidoreductase [Streptantibioticus ferralitis]|uniref:NAD(P)/FAD-dependent oxidoreductase n=1 Tax=Streptantibioticus ferralitis TaxID=236510 RepID=A0ABT5YWL1_9ACTN|nr:NAD(P)/FAD-dependent oxidoreductase [Streptantibioticus ferralitis]MDF2255979.1 NAD(P)/FAD-dependent oxidoreductase [Streptantibioticus ferralitis]
MTKQHQQVPGAVSTGPERTYDVVVVGGGAAGLSGGLALARARRSVLVVDAGEPRNAAAAGVHNYLGREGTPPSELLATGRAEVARYGGTVLAGRVVSARRLADDGGDREGFAVALADGTQLVARRLLVADGLVDELPDIAGLARRWGREVLHCPYCHGWEVRDQAIGVLATGPSGVGQALMFRQWSAEVTLFLHTAPDPTDEQWEQLAARGIAVVHGEVSGVDMTDDRLTGLRLRSGRVVACQAVAVAPRFTARSDVLASLGVEVVERKAGDHVLGSVAAADPTGATEVAGVWVAGNAADLYAGTIQAAAGGLTAAAAINADLIAEDTARAVTAFRARVPATLEPFSAQMEADVCERVLGDRRHGL